MWTIQQRRLPKQSGQSNNVGYQTSVSYTSHAISATKAVRPPTACVLSMQCWLTKKVDYPSQQLSAPKECGLSTQCWLSKDTAGLSKKNWLTANMDHTCSISTECLWAIQAVSTTQGVRWPSKECGLCQPRWLPKESALATQGVRWLPRECGLCQSRWPPRECVGYPRSALATQRVKAIEEQREIA